MPAADGRTLERNYGRPGPAAKPRGRGALIFNRIRPAIRPARRCTPRRRHGFRFGTAERPCGNPFPHGVAAAIILCLLQRQAAPAGLSA